MEENILMFFTRLCLKELQTSSPEVKVSELYMRRRCREKWLRMSEEEKQAIVEMQGDSGNTSSSRSRRQRRTAFLSFREAEQERRGQTIDHR